MPCPASIQMPASKPCKKQGSMFLGKKVVMFRCDAMNRNLPELFLYL